MKVGSLVELVDDSNWQNLSPINYPVKNKIYSVRDIFDWNGRKCIRLDEIINRNFLNTQTEAGYKISRFKELTPPMEISIENILEKVNK